MRLSTSDGIEFLRLYNGSEGPNSPCMLYPIRFIASLSEDEIFVTADLPFVSYTIEPLLILQFTS